MTLTRPTIVLIHGCFSTPACFDTLIPYLERAGYPIIRATFPSSNPQNAYEVSAIKDTEHVRNEYILPLIENDHKTLLLVAHSYGGIVAAGAALGLSKTDRAVQALDGGVLGLVYISGNIANQGHTLIESAGGQWPPWLIKDKPRPGTAYIDPLIETLAHDAEDSLHPAIFADAVPQGYRCLETPVPAPCWAEKGYSGRLAYVRTGEDRINPLFAQDLFMESTGVQWCTATMETSHCPHLSQPGRLTEIMGTFVEKFEAS